MKLNKLLLLDLMGPFFFGLAAFATVFFVGSYLEDLIKWMGEGMSLFTALKAIIFVLPSIFGYILPMSTLLAVLLGMSRLSGDSEITALFAGGVSLSRIAAPFAVFGIIVTIVSFFLSEYVSSRAFEQFKTIQAQYTQKKAKGSEPFSYFEKSTNSHIYVNGGIADAEKGILKDITIVRYAKKEYADGAEENIPETVIHAKEAAWKGLIGKSADPVEQEKEKFTFVLSEGFIQKVGDDAPQAIRFGKTRSAADLSTQIEMTPEVMRAYQMSKNKPRERSFTELGNAMKSLKPFEDRYEQEMRVLAVSRLNKLALPMASFIFALLAVPLGIKRNRSSSSVGFGISLLLILVYYLIWEFASGFAMDGKIPAFLGSFAANILGFIAAVILIRRTAK